MYYINIKRREILNYLLHSHNFHFISELKKNDLKYYLFLKKTYTSDSQT